MFWRLAALIVFGSLAVAATGAALALVWAPTSHQAPALTVLETIVTLAIGLGFVILAAAAFLLPVAAYMDEDDDETPTD